MGQANAVQSWWFSLFFLLSESPSPSQVVSEDRNAEREESRPIPKHALVALSSHYLLFCFFSLAELNRDE